MLRKNTIYLIIFTNKILFVKKLLGKFWQVWFGSSSVSQKESSHALNKKPAQISQRRGILYWIADFGSVLAFSVWIEAFYGNIFRIWIICKRTTDRHEMGIFFSSAKTFSENISDTFGPNWDRRKESILTLIISERIFLLHKLIPSQ